MDFGGVQNSGIGAYHGKVGFDAFTHYKSTMKKSTLIETGIRNPPFNEQEAAPAEAGHAGEIASACAVLPVAPPP